MVQEDAIDYTRYHERLTGGEDHWELLDRFLLDWHQSGPYTFVIPGSRVEAAECRLGFRLPAALKRWYALGQRPLRYWLVGHTQVSYPEHLALQVGDYVPFHAEQQDCCEWAFRASDAELNDPPVYIGLERTPGKMEWFHQNATLSEFALQRVISDVVIGGASISVFLPDAPAGIVAEIERRYRPLGFPEQLWYHYTLYGGPDVIVNLSEGFRIGDGYWVNLAARSETALEAALAAFPAAWERRSADRFDCLGTSCKVEDLAWDGSTQAFTDLFTDDELSELETSLFQDEPESGA